MHPPLPHSDVSDASSVHSSDISGYDSASDEESVSSHYSIASSTSATPPTTTQKITKPTTKIQDTLTLWRLTHPAPPNILAPDSDSDPDNDDFGPQTPIHPDIPDKFDYTLNGTKIEKPEQQTLAQFMKHNTVVDPETGQTVTLSKQDIQFIHKLDEVGYEMENYIDFFTQDVLDHPVVPPRIQPLSHNVKPDRGEMKKIKRIIRAMAIAKQNLQKKVTRNLNLWTNDDKEVKDHIMNIKAPKVIPPKNQESYNPPKEYLLTSEELEKKEKYEEYEGITPTFTPAAYTHLRKVPYYQKLVNEKFSRCLDLYLCPRVVKNKLQMDPESLLPALPDLESLLPYPTFLATTLVQLQSKIIAISVRKYIAVATESAIRIMDLDGCLIEQFLADDVHSLAWNPRFDILAYSSGTSIHLHIAASIGKKAHAEAREFLDQVEVSEKWRKDRIVLPHVIKQIVWHRKGDYLATVNDTEGAGQVMMHQISKSKSQVPFSRHSGVVNQIAFHPTKPYFFVATQQHIKMYNLQAQSLLKRISPGQKLIASIAVHPSGDHVLSTSHDGKTSWTDLDLGDRPYKAFRSESVMRTVAFHTDFPLFATGGDEGILNVWTGKVSPDLGEEPLICPVHVLKHGSPVYTLAWVPGKPWLVTGGLDGSVKLFT